MFWNFIFCCQKLFWPTLPQVFFGLPWHPLNIAKFGQNHDLTVCMVHLYLNLSLVIEMETIAGCQAIRFFPRISKLVSDLRKMYSTHCQIMILTKFCDIKRTSRMSKKTGESWPKQFLATKYEIAKHLGLPFLLEVFGEGHTGQNLRYFISYLKIWKSQWVTIINRFPILLMHGFWAFLWLLKSMHLHLKSKIQNLFCIIYESQF